MRIIDYYNIAATVLMLALVCAAVSGNVRGKLAGRKEGPASGTVLRSDPVRESGSWLRGRRYWIAVCAVLLLGAFLRLWNLTGIPCGLQPDEASIGYEAYSLATYGIDRNGYHWPVYPITWGSGGGSPLMIYLNVITTKLFGASIWSIRIVPAALGVVTLLLFYGMLLRGFGRRTALAGLLVLSVTPWHIILSRWSLDSNTTPFWQLLAAAVFLYAATGDERRRVFLYPAAALFGVCMYSYGSADVVIPLTLVLISIWGLRHEVLTWKRLAGCAAAFAAVCLPLGIFYAINFLDLPEIAAEWISFPRFTASHFSSVFVAFDASLPSALLSNMKGLLQILTVGDEQEVLNAMPGYWTLYVFTWPVLLVGMADGFHMWWADRKKGRVSSDSAVNAVMMSELTAALIFSLFVQQTLNRLVLLFLPLVYCLVMGFRWIYRSGRGHSRELAGIAVSLLLVGAVSFVKDYYGGKYNEETPLHFMPGYGDAMVYADELAQQMEGAVVYSTYENVASPAMLTLYYTRYDTYDYLDTVVYQDEEAEFRIAVSFGHFEFGLPTEDTSDLSSLMEEEFWDDVFVLSKSEADQFDESQYEITWFGDRFAVVVRRQD